MRTMHINGEEIKYKIGRSFVNIIKGGKRFNFSREQVQGKMPVLNNEEWRAYEMVFQCGCLYACGSITDYPEHRDKILEYRNWVTCSAKKVRDFIIKNLK